MAFCSNKICLNYQKIFFFFFYLISKWSNLYHCYLSLLSIDELQYLNSLFSPDQYPHFSYFSTQLKNPAQSLGACRICWLHLCRGVTLCSMWLGYDTKPSDSEAPVLELGWMWSTSLLPLLQGPLWLQVVVFVSLLYGSNRNFESFTILETI